MSLCGYLSEGICCLCNNAFFSLPKVRFNSKRSSIIWPVISQLRVASGKRSVIDLKYVVFTDNWSFKNIFFIICTQPCVIYPCRWRARLCLWSYVVQKHNAVPARQVYLQTLQIPSIVYIEPHHKWLLCIPEENLFSTLQWVWRHQQHYPYLARRHHKRQLNKNMKL